MNLHLFSFLLLLEEIISISLENSFRLSFFQNSSFETYINKSKEEINHLYFQNLFHHKLLTQICAGSQKKCFNLEVSFDSPYTWLTSNSNSSITKEYQPLKSTSYKNLKIPDKLNISYSNRNFIIKGNYSKDTMKFSQNGCFLMDFFSVNINNNSNKNIINIGQLGLGKVDLFSQNNINNINITDKKYKYPSLIEQLVKKDLIDSKNFGIYFINSTHGEILLGLSYEDMGIEAKYKHYFTEFTLLNNSLTILPTIESAYLINDFQRKKKNTKRLVILEKLRINLDFSSSFIVLTKDLFDQITNTIFTKYFNGDICEKRTENVLLNITYIICNKLIEDTDLGTLEIRFSWRNKLYIQLDESFLPFGQNMQQGEEKNNNNDQKKLLFNKNKRRKIIKKEKNLLFGIVSKIEKGDKEKEKCITLGNVFLRNYITYINREKETVRIYDEEIMDDDYFTNEINIKNIVFIIVLAIIVIGLLFYMLNVICDRTHIEDTPSPEIEKFLRKDPIPFKLKTKKKRKYKGNYFDKKYFNF